MKPNFKDLTSADGMKQATEMIGKLTDYWLDKPERKASRCSRLYTICRKRKRYL